MPSIIVEQKYCKGCGLCIPACPRNLIHFAAEHNLRGYRPAVLTEPERCTGCCLCAAVCPDAAIEVYRGEPQPAAPVPSSPTDR